MIRLLPLAFLFALFVGCKDQHQAKPAHKIRILSWNLDWFPAQMNAFSDFSLFGTGVSACTGSGGRRPVKMMIYLGGEIPKSEPRPK